jgi:SAM-dependent methyltransferase
MSAADREKWDARWRERGAPGEPMAWLGSLSGRLPTAGSALDVAGGAGRHAIWLARRGLRVTLVDVSPEALRLAREAGVGLPLETVLADLEAEALPVGPFDLILVSHFFDRAVWAGLAQRLAPDGLLVLAHLTTTNLERHASPSAQFLIPPGSLPAWLPGIEPILVEEGWSAEGRHEARLLGRRARS